VVTLPHKKGTEWPWTPSSPSSSLPPPPTKEVEEEKFSLYLWLDHVAGTT
jgi:hypothetical protein